MDIVRGIVIPAGWDLNGNIVKHEKKRWIDEQIFGKKRRHPVVTDAIYELKTYLKKRLAPIDKFRILKIWNAQFWLQ